jgi:hypothetical protein
MSELPKIELPLYTLKVPSSGEEITVRPFLVKEEKLLLMAIESNEETDIINTTKQIINNCVIKGKIDLDTTPFFDVDYLFIALRAKSIGETIDVRFTCNNIPENGVPCNANFKAQIDIANVKVIKDDSIPTSITVGGGITFKMKYPNYETMKIILDDEHAMNKKIRIIAACIEMIQNKDKIISLKDITPQELIEYIEGLTQGQFRMLEQFVDNLPTFVVTTKNKCTKCGFEHQIDYKDFTSFFV